nr:ribonuclease H-like domain-containing protein [Tanacetum cinerariifolium]
EVIEFGDSYKAPQEEAASKSSVKKKGRTVVITTEDMQKRRNDAILKTFGGNEATKKTKKNQLKQQYGNFKAEGSETLEQTYSRLQAIVSHLAFMDVEIEQDDLNQKFLTSLTPEWLMYTIVWGYRANTSSEKGNVHTASVPTASTQVSTAIADVAVASISHDTVCVYIASQLNGSQIKYEDITQIDEDDIEEMDIKWNMDLLSMRAERFWKKTGWDWSYMANEEANHALVANDQAPTEFTLMAKSSSSSKNEVFDDSFCSKSCRKNTDSLNTKISKLNEELSDCENTLYHYKLGLSQVETRLIEFKTQEIKFCKKIRGLEFDVEFKNNKIEHLMNELEQVKKEKDGLDSKLTGFESALKDLDTLLGCQRTNKNKEGLGYSVVPPPVQVYSPPNKDMSWTGVPEFADDTITDYSRPSPSIESSTIESPTVIKTNKVETARKSPVKYDEMYRNTLKSPIVRDIKLKDDTIVLLRTPRQHNMYSIDLNNIVPHKDQTCLVAKASADESRLWHRRLDPLNFKTMNKLVRNNLVKGTTDIARQSVKKDVSSLRYIALPNWFHEAHLESSNSDAQDACNADAPKSSGISNPTATSKSPPAEQMESLTVESVIPTVSLPVPTACLDNSLETSSDTRLVSKGVTSQEETPSLDNILTFSNRFEDILRDTTNIVDTNGVEADLSNMESIIPASPIPTFRIYKDHPKSQIISPLDTPVQTRHKSKEMEEHSFIATIHQKTTPDLL